MATITKSFPVQVPPPPTFTLTLSNREAQAVYRLLNVGHRATREGGGSFNVEHEQVTSEVWRTFRNAGFSSLLPFPQE